MTVEEKSQIVDEFDEDNWNSPVIKRPSARSRITDVLNVKRSIQGLV